MTASIIAGGVIFGGLKMLMNYSTLNYSFKISKATDYSVALLF
jgi:hypothetical protein